MSIKDKNEILKQRAIILAQESEQKINKDEYIEVLEFMISNDRYIIENSYLHEVYPIKELTEIPFTPSYIMGVINVRGNIFSVIDIKTLFNKRPEIITEKSKAIIVKNENMEFSIHTEKIIGVNFVLKSELQPPPSTLSGIEADYISGISKDGLIFLDVGKMLSDKRMIVQQDL